MAKYTFPAIFQKDTEGYCITFPDLPSCITQGDDLTSGLDAASDALCLVLYHMEENGEKIPHPTAPEVLKAPEDAFVSIVGCDTLEYRKFYNSRAVKKTLTIPQWLDEMATKQGLNFSKTLQRGLMEDLGIEQNQR